MIVSWNKIINFIKSLPYRFKKTGVKAVHEKDLPGLLVSLGILEKVKSARYKCLYCNKIINLNNLGAIVFKDKKINIICSGSGCITKYDL